MSRPRQHLSLVVDEVLAQASASAHRRNDEALAIKAAEAMPRAEMARGLRSLADALRSNNDTLTYADLAGVL